MAHMEDDRRTRSRTVLPYLVLERIIEREYLPLDKWPPLAADSHARADLHIETVVQCQLRIRRTGVRAHVDARAHGRELNLERRKQRRRLSTHRSQRSQGRAACRQPCGNASITTASTATGAGTATAGGAGSAKVKYVPRTTGALEALWLREHHAVTVQGSPLSSNPLVRLRGERRGRGEGWQGVSRGLAGA